MGLLDVSSWQVDDERQVSGTRAKHWLIHPEDTRQRYLYKIPKVSIGEVWAEKIASEIGKIMRLPIMDAEIVKRGETIAILTKSFVNKGEELFEGGDLFFAIAEDFNRNDLKHYDFMQIVKILSEFDLDRDFIKIPIFDALIASEDRHCDNWGIIANSEGYRIAPIYDNGSSLGFQLLEDRIIKMFRDENMFKAFCNRSFSLIGLPTKRKPKYLELLSVINITILKK